MSPFHNLTVAKKSKCCVPNCDRLELRTHRFPKLHEEVYNIWLRRIGYAKLFNMDPVKVHKNYVVCDKHFSEECRVPNSNKLKVYSLPSLHLPESCAHGEYSKFALPATQICGDLNGVKSEPATSTPCADSEELLLSPCKKKQRRYSPTYTNETKRRTQGDGMENIQPSSEVGVKNKNIKIRLGDQLIYRPSDNSSSYLRPVVPKGRVINLVPKYIPKEKKQQLYITKPKDPKFVPYEPYKAAIEPIIPKKKREAKKVSKNNVDIHDLVSQMSEMATAEINKAKKEALQNDELLIPRKQWETERIKFETDIKNLRETNTHLENQLKFQAQVNSELKTLLVAAVGEDLESRVQHLTEDKLALARELLNSANHLTSHREHTEWLSGQCEVWRSKFLASSLMVEELARWKSALSNKVAEMKDILKKVMDERNRIRDFSLKTYNSLTSINEHHPCIEHTPIPKNILDIAVQNHQLSSALEKSLLKELPEPRRHKIPEEDSYTCAESLALVSLRNPVMLSDSPDICSAVVGATVQIGKGQMFLQNPSDHTKCCKHCKGDVKEI